MSAPRYFYSRLQHTRWMAQYGFARALEVSQQLPNAIDDPAIQQLQQALHECQQILQAAFRPETLEAIRQDDARLMADVERAKSRRRHHAPVAS
jgi:hypothetical protein